MILYTNGDSHTAAAECVNNHAFAEDDKQYWMMGRAPHPDNLAVSFSKLLSNRLSCGLVCSAESASSNDRIIRTTKQWMENFKHELYRTFMLIQWSTWEREEWLIDGVLYQINASGTDHVPVSHQDQYKDYISNINWHQKTRDAHEEIWNFHQELESMGVKHIFFNGNNDFSKIEIQKDWGTSFIGPYNPASTYDAIVSKKCETVSPTSYHYGTDGHRVWAQFLTKYIVDNKLI
mgnify:FL=1|tara:strand:+ start:2206 stop:2907 length:702 start_codon:yes stop_codon:yes gene_type:complete